MPTRTQTLAVVVVLLAGTAGALYVAVSLMGWLAEKASKLPQPPGAPAGERFEVRVQYRNVGRQTLALREFTLAPVEAEVVDSRGTTVPATSEAPAAVRIGVSAPDESAARAHPCGRGT